MKQYQEIRRILVEDFGFSDLAAYRQWVESKRSALVPSSEMIARLSPDVVDCRDFWRVCDELFTIRSGLQRGGKSLGWPHAVRGGDAGGTQTA